MKRYRVMSPISLHVGEVGLTKKQFERRKHSRSLEEKRPGVYKIVGQVNFKAGEEISINQAPIKVFGDKLKCLDKKTGNKR